MQTNILYLTNGILEPNFSILVFENFKTKTFLVRGLKLQCNCNTNLDPYLVSIKLAKLNHNLFV